MLKVIKYSAKISSEICNIGCIVSDLINCIRNIYGEIDDSIIFEIKVIVNELLVNAIRHGNCEIKDKFVKIAAGITECEYAFILIEDEGKGFNYKCIINRNSSQPAFDICINEEECGRGLLIVSCLCDKIRFNRRGNKVLIYKRLTV